MKTVIERDIKAALRIDNQALMALYSLLKAYENAGPGHLFFSITHLGGEKTRIESSEDLAAIPNGLRRRVISIFATVSGVTVFISAKGNSDAGDFKVDGDPDFAAVVVRQLEGWVEGCRTGYTWAALNAEGTLITCAVILLLLLSPLFHQSFYFGGSRFDVLNRLTSFGMICITVVWVTNLLTNRVAYFFPIAVFEFNGGNECYDQPAHRRKALGFTFWLGLGVSAIGSLMKFWLHR